MDEPTRHDSTPDDLLDRGLAGSDDALATWLAALTQAPTPAELAGEADVVAQMRAAIVPMTAATVVPLAASRAGLLRRRMTRGAAVAAFAALGLGGVAAAATGTNPLAPILGGGEQPSLSAAETTSSTTSTGSTTSTVTTTRATTTTAPTTTVADASRTSGAPATTVDCDDARNHGEYVSSVAKAGGDVTEAAHSSCGKPDDTDESVATTRHEDEHEDDDEDDDTPKSSTTSRPTTTRHSDDGPTNGNSGKNRR